MQCKSFPPECYSNNLNLDPNGGFWPLNNLDRTVINGHHYNGISSSLIPDANLKHCKELLRQTMLKHEAIVEDQIHELHRLYWRQKELMLEMQGKAFYNYPTQLGTSLSNAFASHSMAEDTPSMGHNASPPWMNHDSPSSISNAKSSLSPLSSLQGTSARFDLESQNEPSLRDTESVVKDCKKFGKKILDLELPAYEYLDSDEERFLDREKVHEVPQILNNPLENYSGFSCKNEEEPSFRSTNLESNHEPKDLAHSFDPSKRKFFLDLNEPIKIEDAAASISSEYPVSQDQCGKMDSEKNSETDNARVKMIYNEYDAGTGIDLNSSPQTFCPEKKNALEHVEFKQSHELPPVPPSRKRGPGQATMVVQALPCFTSSAASRKRLKPLNERFRCQKTDGANLNQDALCNGAFKLDLNTRPDLDESSSSPPPLEAPVSPESKESAQRTAESENNQPSLENEKSAPSVDSTRSQTLLENKETNSSSLVQETQAVQDEQARLAAETLVNLSQINVLKDLSFAIAKLNPHGYLHWFADIATSTVLDGPKRESIMSLDDFEAVTLKLIDVNVEEQYCTISSTDPKSGVIDVSSSILSKTSSVPSKPRRGRQKRRDFRKEILPSLVSLSRNEVTEDLQVMEGLIQAAGAQWEGVSTRNSIKNRSSRGRKRSCGSASSKVTETGMHNAERRNACWGTVTRRRRGPRTPGKNIRFLLSKV